MRKLGSEQYHIGVKLFRTGVYFHLRLGRSFRHLKLATWSQSGLRLSTRRQLMSGRMPRYVTFRRFHMSYWASKDGRQQKPRQAGFGFYWG